MHPRHLHSRDFHPIELHLKPFTQETCTPEILHPKALHRRDLCTPEKCTLETYTLKTYTLQPFTLEIYTLETCTLARGTPTHPRRKHPYSFTLAESGTSGTRHSKFHKTPESGIPKPRIPIEQNHQCQAPPGGVPPLETVSASVRHHPAYATSSLQHRHPPSELGTPRVT